jgi:hypothetical protein
VDALVMSSDARERSVTDNLLIVLPLGVRRRL